MGLVAAGLVLLLMLRASRDARETGESSEEGVQDEAAPASETGILGARGGTRTGSTERATSSAPPADVPLPAPAAGSIVGVVLDPKGRPAAGATVRFLDVVSMAERPAGFFTDLGTTSTRSDGSFSRMLVGSPELDPMEYGVMAEGDGVLRSDPVNAQTGGPPVVLRLVHREVVRVRVLDPAGHAVAGAALQLSSALKIPNGWWGEVPAGMTQVQILLARDLRRLSATTDATGVATLALGAPEATCALFVAPPRDRDDVTGRLISPWTPTQTSVSLAPTLVIEGRAQDADGAPVTEGYVEARLPTGAWTRTRIEYDATFQFGALPAGPVALRYRPDTVQGKCIASDGPALATDKIVGAGSRDVVLVVDLGAELRLRVEGWPREPGGTAILTPEGAEPQKVGDSLAAMLTEITAEIGLDGTARLRGLDPKTRYTLWIPPWIDGLQSGTDEAPVYRMAYRKHVQAADSPLTIALAEGVYVHGRLLRKGLELLLKEGHYAAKVQLASHGVRLAGWITPEGTFGIAGLPPGTWPTRIDVFTDVFDGDSSQRYWSATPVLSTEKPELDVTLEPAPDPNEPTPAGR